MSIAGYIDRNTALKKVNNARTKWGLSSVGKDVVEGERINVVDGINDLLKWLREANRASGANISIMSDKSPEDVITDEYTTIEQNADAIYNYCRCHGNCRDSCSGSCQNSCYGSCSGDGCGSSCGHGCMTT